jgi:hypothetical protein
MLISLPALAVIFFGCRYAVMRERLRRADLHACTSKKTRRSLVGICKMHLCNGDI